jgi:hypothetical protein
VKIRQLRKDQDAGSDDGAAASRRVTPAGGEHVTGARNDPPPHRYRIRVRGHLGQTTRGAFPALQARASGGDTVLTGPLPDRAALHGVLAAVPSLSHRRRPGRQPGVPAPHSRVPAPGAGR